jgi:hypothetical protein
VEVSGRSDRGCGDDGVLQLNGSIEHLCEVYGDVVVTELEVVEEFVTLLERGGDETA